MSHPAAAPLPPLRRQVRWRILALLFAITVIAFIDRQTLSVAAPLLRNTFHLSNTDYGRIVSAFMLGMTAAEAPIGWWIDRRGVRLGLSIASAWWSAGTALHSIARNAGQFALFRFWMGTGECANFSGGMKVVSDWFPERERALATGLFNSGAMIGAVLAPPVIVFITLRWGWRMAFLFPAALGFLWSILWRRYYTPPEHHPALTTEERSYVFAGRSALQSPTPVSRLLARKEIWGLMLCRMLVGPVVQFYWFWTPEYLFRARGLTLAQIGWFSWVPFLFGDLGNIAGGWLAGRLLRRGASLATARYTTMGFGALCCLLSAAVVGLHSSISAIALICIVLFGHTCLSANMFAAFSDVAPRAAVSRVTGLTGLSGGFSGLLFPLLTGYLIDRFSYAPVFLMASLMPLAGLTLLWLLSGRLAPLDLSAGSELVTSKLTQQ